MRRWSKLQKRLYGIIAPEVNLQIHCAVYRMDSQRGSTSLPRYWITLDQEIIWEYPKQFVALKHPGRNPSGYYPYKTDISDISNLIEEYLDTPKDELLEKHFEDDHWGLINILKSADRRIGARRLNELRKKTYNKASRKVLKRRLQQQAAV